MFALVFLSFLLIYSLESGIAFEFPEEIPGNYDGKWYGIHCSDVPRETMLGVRYGEAFPDQKIIDSWGYKGKPIEEIKDLLPEMFYSICSNPDEWGAMRINETAYIPLEKWPGEHQKVRKQVTEKYKGTAKLDDKGHLANWISGFPFPDSENGLEIAWNFVNARNYGEELLARFYTSVVDRAGNTRYSVSEQCYFWWKGRLHGEHIPRYEPNPNNYEFFSSLGFYSPYDLRGVVMITHRYDEADRQDDMWMYLSVLRRVRRMSTAQRWDKFPGGSDLTYDAVTGFQGKPTNYEWRYLGRKELLCLRQAKDSIQEIKGKPIGACDQLYQRTNTVLVEYIPKITATISRAVMYLDNEIYACFYVEFFDKRGRPYILITYPWVVQASGYQSPIGFVVSDVQRAHSSLINTYDEYQDLDGVKLGISPSFFTMEFLRKRYGGR